MLGSLISLGVEGVRSLLFLPTDRQTDTQMEETGSAQDDRTGDFLPMNSVQLSCSRSRAGGPLALHRGPAHPGLPEPPTPVNLGHLPPGASLASPRGLRTLGARAPHQARAAWGHRPAWERQRHTAEALGTST